MTKLSKPAKNEKRVGESALKKVIESDLFYNKPKISEGGELFYFYTYGDYLKGFLLKRQTRDLTHYRQVTYKMKALEMRQDGEEVPIKYPDGLIVEFPGLKYLRKIIDKNELLGSLVRIVYIGREKSGRGHSAKVFDVFKDVGVMSEKESYQSPPIKRKRKKKVKRKRQKKSDA